LRKRALVLLAASTWFAPERVVWSQVGRYRFCAEHNERRTVNCLRRSRTLQNGDIAESLYRSIQPFWRHSRNGKKHAGTTSPMTWVFASRRHRGRKPIWGQAILRRYIRPVA